METIYLTSKAISSALNRRKKFHLSRVFFSNRTLKMARQ